MSRLKRGVSLSKKIKYSLFILIAVLLFKLSFIGRGSILSAYKNSVKAKQSKEQYEELLIKIEETELEINSLLKNEEYLIKVAREEYGMQKENEHVIKQIETEENNNPTGE